MRRPGSPSLLFRTAVVIAGVALVAGIAGAARLAGRQLPPPRHGLTRITVRGAPQGPLVRLEVMWWDGGTVVADVGRRTDDPEAWMAGPLPTDRDVWVRLLDDRDVPAREVQRWRVRIVKGEGLVLDAASPDR